MSSELFEVGETYHRVEDIHDKFGGNRYSGIAPCSEYPYIFVFFGESGEWHGYDDELLDDGTFLYTGEGREGDMEMERGNAAIKNHEQNGDELHVFEIKKEAWQVTYVGQYRYKTHHWVRLPDRNDQRRDAIRIELVPIGGREMDTGEERLENLATEELYEQAKAR